MKKVVRVLVIIVAIIMTGCSLPGGSSGKGAEIITNSFKHPTPNIIDQVEWDVFSGVKDDERKVIFTLTNNSAYIIRSIDIKYVVKDDLGEDNKDDLYTELNACPSEVKKYIKTESDITIHAFINDAITSGETYINGSVCFFKGEKWEPELKNIAIMDFLTPDIATIEYLDGEFVYTAGYDFLTNKYFESNKRIAYEWEDTELSSLLPKPNNSIVEIMWNDEDSFFFDAYPASLESTSKYIDMCKEKGFNNIDYDISDSTGVLFVAMNDCGNEISIEYRYGYNWMSSNLSLTD